jgi:hypothetical protein
MSVYDHPDIRRFSDDAIRTFFRCPSPHTAFVVSAGSSKKPTKHGQFDIATLGKKIFI